MPQQAERNPQTVAFLDMLGLLYNLDHLRSAEPASESVAGKCLAVPRLMNGLRDPSNGHIGRYAYILRLHNGAVLRRLAAAHMGVD